MGRGLSKKQKEAQRRISELEIIKRNGMIQAIAAFVGLTVIIALKLGFQSQGAEWANSTFANMAIFILAIVAAGIAGMGTRAWSKAKSEIAELEKRL